jgi:hypothetical protein
LLYLSYVRYELITPTPVVPTHPPSDAPCGQTPHPNSAPNFPVRIIAINKLSEVVTLVNLGSTPVNLDGWRMCSILNNQKHRGVGGVLAPGELKDFAELSEGTIWNDNQRDDGALYDERGRLVSNYIVGR